MRMEFQHCAEHGADDPRRAVGKDRRAVLDELPCYVRNLASRFFRPGGEESAVADQVVSYCWEVVFGVSSSSSSCRSSTLVAPGLRRLEGRDQIALEEICAGRKSNWICD